MLFEKYIEESGLSIAFQIIFAEIISKKIAEDQVFRSPSASAPPTGINEEATPLPSRGPRRSSSSHRGNGPNESRTGAPPSSTRASTAPTAVSSTTAPAGCGSNTATDPTGSRRPTLHCWMGRPTRPPASSATQPSTRPREPRSDLTPTHHRARWDHAPHFLPADLLVRLVARLPRRRRGQLAAQ